MEEKESEQPTVTTTPEEVKVEAGDPSLEKENKFIQDCKELGSKSEVNDSDISVLTNLWREFQDGYKNTEFVCADRCFETLLICTSRVVLNLQYTKKISPAVKSELKASIVACGETLLDCPHRKRLCNGISSIVENPWTASAFNEVATSGIAKKEAVETLWVTEGWVMLETRVDYLAGTGRKGIDRLCSVLNVLVEKGHENQKARDSNSTESNAKNFHPYQFPYKKYVEYLGVYAMFYVNGNVKTQIIDEWEDIVLLDVISSLYDNAVNQTCTQLFPKVKLWKDVGSIAKSLAKEATWKALKSESGVLLEEFFSKWMELSNCGSTGMEQSGLESPIDEILKDTNQISFTENMYRIAKATVNVMGKTTFTRQKYVELFVMALTKDADDIVALKNSLQDETEKIKALDRKLSLRYLDLAVFFKEHPVTAKNCLLTAFSLNPCYKLYFLLFPCETENINIETDNEEDNTVLGDCNELKDIALDSADGSADDEDLGFHSSLSDDLETVIQNPRYKGFLRLQMNSNELKEQCRKLLDSKSVTVIENKSLDHLNVDYEKYKDLKPQYDPDDDGIEKGYRPGERARRRHLLPKKPVTKKIMRGKCLKVRQTALQRARHAPGNRKKGRPPKQPSEKVRIPSKRSMDEMRQMPNILLSVFPWSDACKLGGFYKEFYKTCIRTNDPSYKPTVSPVNEADLIASVEIKVNPTGIKINDCGSAGQEGSTANTGTSASNGPSNSCSSNKNVNSAAIPGIPPDAPEYYQDPCGGIMYEFCRRYQYRQFVHSMRAEGNPVTTDNYHNTVKPQPKRTIRNERKDSRITQEKEKSPRKPKTEVIRKRRTNNKDFVDQPTEHLSEEKHELNANDVEVVGDTDLAQIKLDPTVTNGEVVESIQVSASEERPQKVTTTVAEPPPKPEPIFAGAFQIMSRYSKGDKPENAENQSCEILSSVSSQPVADPTPDQGKNSTVSNTQTGDQLQKSEKTPSTTLDTHAHPLLASDTLSKPAQDTTTSVVKPSGEQSFVFNKPFKTYGRHRKIVLKTRWSTCETNKLEEYTSAVPVPVPISDTLISSDSERQLSSSLPVDQCPTVAKHDIETTQIVTPSATVAEQFTSIKVDIKPPFVNDGAKQIEAQITNVTDISLAKPESAKNISEPLRLSTDNEDAVSIASDGSSILENKSAVVKEYEDKAAENKDVIHCSGSNQIKQQSLLSILDVEPIAPEILITDEFPNARDECCTSVSKTQILQNNEAPKSDFVAEKSNDVLHSTQNHIPPNLDDSDSSNGNLQNAGNVEIDLSGTNSFVGNENNTCESSDIFPTLESGTDISKNIKSPNIKEQKQSVVCDATKGKQSIVKAKITLELLPQVRYLFGKQKTDQNGVTKIVHNSQQHSASNSTIKPTNFEEENMQLSKSKEVSSEMHDTRVNSEGDIDIQAKIDNKETDGLCVEENIPSFPKESPETAETSAQGCQLETGNFRENEINVLSLSTQMSASNAQAPNICTEKCKTSVLEDEPPISPVTGARNVSEESNIQSDNISDLGVLGFDDAKLDGIPLETSLTSLPKMAIESNEKVALNITEVSQIHIKSKENACADIQTDLSAIPEEAREAITNSGKNLNSPCQESKFEPASTSDDATGAVDQIDEIVHQLGNEEAHVKQSEVNMEECASEILQLRSSVPVILSPKSFEKDSKFEGGGGEQEHENEPLENSGSEVLFVDPKEDPNVGKENTENENIPIENSVIEALSLDSKEDSNIVKEHNEHEYDPIEKSFPELLSFGAEEHYSVEKMNQKQDNKTRILEVDPEEVPNVGTQNPEHETETLEKSLSVVLSVNQEESPNEEKKEQGLILEKSPVKILSVDTDEGHIIMQTEEQTINFEKLAPEVLTVNLAEDKYDEEEEQVHEIQTLEKSEPEILSVDLEQDLTVGRAEHSTALEKPASEALSIDVETEKHASLTPENSVSSPLVPEDEFVPQVNQNEDTNVGRKEAKRDGEKTTNQEESQHNDVCDENLENHVTGPSFLADCSSQHDELLVDSLDESNSEVTFNKKDDNSADNISSEKNCDSLLLQRKSNDIVGRHALTARKSKPNSRQVITTQLPLGAQSKDVPSRPLTPVHVVEEIMNKAFRRKPKRPYEEEDCHLKLAPTVIKHVEDHGGPFRRLFKVMVEVKRLRPEDLSPKNRKELEDIRRVKRSSRLRMKKSKIVNAVWKGEFDASLEDSMTESSSRSDSDADIVLVCEVEKPSIAAPSGDDTQFPCNTSQQNYDSEKARLPTARRSGRAPFKRKIAPSTDTNLNLYKKNRLTNQTPKNWKTEKTTPPGKRPVYPVRQALAGDITHRDFLSENGLASRSSTPSTIVEDEDIIEDEPKDPLFMIDEEESNRSFSNGKPNEPEVDVIYLSSDEEDGDYENKVKGRMPESEFQFQTLRSNFLPPLSATEQNEESSDQSLAPQYLDIKNSEVVKENIADDSSGSSDIEIIAIQTCVKTAPCSSSSLSASGANSKVQKLKAPTNPGRRFTRLTTEQSTKTPCSSLSKDGNSTVPEEFPGGGEVTHHFSSTTYPDPVPNSTDSTPLLESTQDNYKPTDSTDVDMYILPDIDPESNDECHFKDYLENRTSFEGNESLSIGTQETIGPFEPASTEHSPDIFTSSSDPTETNKRHCMENNLDDKTNYFTEITAKTAFSQNVESGYLSDSIVDSNLVQQVEHTVDKSHNTVLSHLNDRTSPTAGETHETTSKYPKSSSSTTVSQCIIEEIQADDDQSQVADEDNESQNKFRPISCSTVENIYDDHCDTEINIQVHRNVEMEQDIEVIEDTRDKLIKTSMNTATPTDPVIILNSLETESNIDSENDEQLIGETLIDKLCSTEPAETNREVMTEDICLKEAEAQNNEQVSSDEMQTLGAVPIGSPEETNVRCLQLKDNVDEIMKEKDKYSPLNISTKINMDDGIFPISLPLTADLEINLEFTISDPSAVSNVVKESSEEIELILQQEELDVISDITSTTSILAKTQQDSSNPREAENLPRASTSTEGAKLNENDCNNSKIFISGSKETLIEDRLIQVVSDTSKNIALIETPPEHQNDAPISDLLPIIPQTRSPELNPPTLIPEPNNFVRLYQSDDENDMPPTLEKEEGDIDDYR